MPNGGVFNKFGLTDKQERFCHEFVLNGGNAARAAVTAGYASNSSDSFASLAFENLRKPQIVARLKTLRTEAHLEFGVTAEEVISGLREVRDRALQDIEVLDSKGLPTGEYKSDLTNAKGALDSLGKVIGLFVDKREITGKDGTALIPANKLTREQLEAELANELAKGGTPEGETEMGQGAD